MKHCTVRKIPYYGSSIGLVKLESLWKSFVIINKNPFQWK